VKFKVFPHQPQLPVRPTRITTLKKKERDMRQANPIHKISAVLLACGAMLSACGGGGGDTSANSGGHMQLITFPYVGNKVNMVNNTVTLAATTSSGLPVTYSTPTPGACSVSGDQLTVLTVDSECSVVASQSGGTDAKGLPWGAADNVSQLFVVTRLAQAVGMINPGWQPLDSQAFSVIAASNLGRPITFTTSTPTVCAVTVDGGSVTKQADGLCVITATQVGDGSYATASATKTIPIGTATAPLLTFASGYKDTGKTAELGSVDTSAGVNIHGWWCGGAPECGTSVDGTSVTVHPKDGSADFQSFPTFTHFLRVVTDAPGDVAGYDNFSVRAPGLTSASSTGDTVGGVGIDSQAALIIHDVAQNAEWVSTTDPKLNVDVVLGKFNIRTTGNDKGKGCNVTLRGVIIPATAGPATYSLPLKELTFQDKCDLPLTSTSDAVLASLQFSSVIQVNITPSTLNHSKPRNDSNGAVLNYPTELTVGAITLQ
jgi:hypothetical protein